MEGSSFVCNMDNLERERERESIYFRIFYGNFHLSCLLFSDEVILLIKNKWKEGINDKKVTHQKAIASLGLVTGKLGNERSL